MNDIKGSTAVVTGAASGIGRALANALSREGARVVVADVDEEGMAGTMASIKGAGGEAMAVKTDVSSLTDVLALADRAWSEFGPVRILCNNAGVSVVGGLETMTQRDWQWIIGVNLWGVINGTLAFIPRMIKENKGGHIVNTASTAGLVPTAYLGAYTTTKYAVVGLSEVLRRDLKTYNIGVSVLCPMAVDTKIGESERVRPEDMKNPGAQPVSISVDFLGRVISPETAARMTVDAIKSDDLYVITHKEAKDLIQRRFQRLMDSTPKN